MARSVARAPATVGASWAFAWIAAGCPWIAPADRSGPASDAPASAPATDDVDGTASPGASVDGEASAPDTGAAPKDCPGGECVLGCSGATCDLTCDGGRCLQLCNATDRCTIDCGGGQCTIACRAAVCDITCPGGTCITTCDGAESCVVDDCPRGCVTRCNGAATCSAACDEPAQCVTVP